MNKQTFTGAIGAGGLVIQIVLGFALAGAASATGSLLILPHMLIGVAGIALVAFLTSSIFLAPSSMVTRLLYGLALVLTLGQVALGFRILAVPDPMLTMAHQGIAIAILVILALASMLAARQRRRSMTATA
ncbi:MAG: hypothetical protein OK455_04435 [Thaumarchaeota archaeon]|nr:hypothetical protein [Nitrososphaerota archaeon]